MIFLSKNTKCYAHKRNFMNFFVYGIKYAAYANYDVESTCMCESCTLRLQNNIYAT